MTTRVLPGTIVDSNGPTAAAELVAFLAACVVLFAAAWLAGFAVPHIERMLGLFGHQLSSMVARGGL